jgi:hypothetical protein
MFLWLRLLGVTDSSVLVKERAIKAKVRSILQRGLPCRCRMAAAFQ